MDKQDNFEESGNSSNNKLKQLYDVLLKDFWFIS